MSELKEYFSNDVVLGLYRVSYNHINELQENISISCIDKIEVEAHDSHSLTVIATREINFEPNSLFSLTVSYFVKHLLKDEYVGKLDWDKYELNEEINSDPEYYSSLEFDRVSLIISQITETFGRSPLITPPSYMPGTEFDDEDEN